MILVLLTLDADIEVRLKGSSVEGILDGTNANKGLCFCGEVNLKTYFCPGKNLTIRCVGLKFENLTCQHFSDKVARVA